MALPADVEAILAKLEPQIAKAFYDAIAQITSQTQLVLIEDALRQEDIEGAVRIISLNPSAFSVLDNAFVQARYQGAVAALALLPRLNDPFPVAAWYLDLMLAILGPRHGSRNTSGA